MKQITDAINEALGISIAAHDGHFLLPEATTEQLTDRERAAWHEAGHVAAALMLGIGVRRVTIIADRKPENWSAGCTYLRYPRWWREAPYMEITPYREGLIMRYAVVLLSGVVAEARKTKRRNWQGARGDLYQGGGVGDLIALLGGGDDAAFNAAFRWLWGRAEQLLARPEVWCQVEAIAAALLERDTLREGDIRQVRRAALDTFDPRFARASAALTEMAAGSTTRRQC